MSRTDKDRPYWVRIADPEEDRRISHTRHWHLGTPIYISLKVRDEDGYPIYDEETYKYSAPIYGMNVWGYLSIIRYEERTKTVTKVCKERKLIGHVPDHCIVDMRNTPDRRNHYTYRGKEDYTCGYQLEFHNRNRPYKKRERKHWHASKREGERTPLVNARKEYNSGENLDDYDHEALNTRTTFYEGWWD